VKCPDELFYGEQPTIYKYLVEYGRIGWVTKRAKIKKKLQPKAFKCFMLGYAKEHAGDTYRMYNPATKKIIMSRDIKWADWSPKSPSADNSVLDTAGIDEDFEPEYDVNDIPVLQPTATPTQVVPTFPTTPNVRVTRSTASKAGRKASATATNTSKAAPTTPSPPVRLSRELRSLKSDLIVPSSQRSLTYDAATRDSSASESGTDDESEQAHYVFDTSVVSDPGEPKQYKDAVKQGPEKECWADSIKAEITNFTKRQVWRKFPRSQLNGRKPLKSRWVFKKKIEPDNTIRYKARVVVKGYNQIPGVDFTESFPPLPQTQQHE
jgi:hypothetical protein